MAPTGKMLDVARLKALVDNWPASGWDENKIVFPYRLALLRGLSAGHFLRKATRTNQ